MDGMVTLIAAYAEEDRRLMELIAGFPVALRETVGRTHRLSLKQTIGHLAFWDDFAVAFYNARLHAGHPDSLTFAEFEKKNRHLLERLCAEDWEAVLASYRRATRELSAFLTEHWDDLADDVRDSFKIPLKHRRYHRRRLAELAESLGLRPGAPSMSERAG